MLAHTRRVGPVDTQDVLPESLNPSASSHAPRHHPAHPRAPVGPLVQHKSPLDADVWPLEYDTICSLAAIAIAGRRPRVQQPGGQRPRFLTSLDPSRGTRLG